MAARGHGRGRRGRASKRGSRSSRGGSQSPGTREKVTGPSSIKLSLSSKGGDEGEVEEEGDMVVKTEEKDAEEAIPEQPEKTSGESPTEKPTSASAGPGTPKQVTGSGSDVSSSTPSATLLSVLKLLDLSYDETIGLLQGDAMYKVPDKDKLEKAGQLLGKLIEDLKSGISKDSEILKNYSQEGFEGLIEKKEREIEKEAQEGEMPVTDLEVAPVRRHTIIKITGGGDGENKIRIKTETSLERERDEDEAGPPVKRRRRSIILTTNGQRKEITPTIAESDDEEIDVVASTWQDTATDVSEDSKRFLPSVYAKRRDQEIDVKKILTPAITQLGLYDDQKARETSENEKEYLKKKLAVSDYPDSDLKDYLPGEIPTKDLSVNRPSNQVAFSSFQNYVEPFFREFTEEDVNLLRQKYVISGHLPKNFVDARETLQIPPLGPLYSDVWREEDRANMSGKSELSGHYMDDIRMAAQKRMDSRMKELTGAHGSADKLDNNSLEGEEQVSCGPLTSRLLSALVGEESFETRRRERQDDEEGGANNFEDLADSEPEGSSSELPGERGYKSALVRTDYRTLDERLKRELKYIGVYMNVQQTLDDPGFEQDWSSKKEDDEICRELRKLQKDLKGVQKANNTRKRVLLPIIEEQIAWQEYLSVLEDLDKQVEQHYRRRMNVTPRKSRKRGPHHKEKENSVGVATKEENSTHLVTSASFQSLLAKRAKWIEKIGPLFKSQKEMRQMPDESIFKDMNEEEDNEGDEGEDEDEDVLGAHRGEEEVQGESLEMGE
ncbi:DEKNAAC102732 [Brettanomyces naardenensis]|uniref:DEKNAAC102732 n=1 Tax=Brettanomyces naardenensis TaxID=13370 RepID=A0A448YLL2_BRENA|nr:DEKNAAC102732 [Brettanomyces naardenensis]